MMRRVVGSARLRRIETLMVSLLLYWLPKFPCHMSVYHFQKNPKTPRSSPMSLFIIAIRSGIALGTAITAGSPGSNWISNDNKNVAPLTTMSAINTLCKMYLNVSKLPPKYDQCYTNEKGHSQLGVALPYVFL